MSALDITAGSMTQESREAGNACQHRRGGGSTPLLGILDDLGGIRRGLPYTKGSTQGLRNRMPDP